MQKTSLLISLVVGILVNSDLLAQDHLTEMLVDRPGIAEATYTVPKGIYQFEVGFEYHRQAQNSTYYYPEVLMRTGILKNTELRLQLRQIANQEQGQTHSGLSPLRLGIKTKLKKQNKYFPEISVIADAIIPFYDHPQPARSVGPELIFLFENDFYPNTSINYNIGLVWDPDLNQDVFTGSFCYNYLPTEKIGLFVEYFSFVTDANWPGEQGADLGITYLIHRNAQIDLSGGYSRIRNEDNFFMSSGISFRFFKKQMGNPNAGNHFNKTIYTKTK